MNVRHKFSTCEAVQLNSGGPPMTIWRTWWSRREHRAFYTCRWIGDDGEWREHEYPTICVRPVGVSAGKSG